MSGDIFCFGECGNWTGGLVHGVARHRGRYVIYIPGWEQAEVTAKVPGCRASRRGSGWHSDTWHGSCFIHRLHSLVNANWGVVVSRPRCVDRTLRERYVASGPRGTGPTLQGYNARAMHRAGASSDHCTGIQIPLYLLYLLYRLRTPTPSI